MHDLTRFCQNPDRSLDGRRDTGKLTVCGRFGMRTLSCSYPWPVSAEKYAMNPPNLSVFHASEVQFPTGQAVSLSLGVVRGDPDGE